MPNALGSVSPKKIFLCISKCPTYGPTFGEFQQCPRQYVYLSPKNFIPSTRY